MDTERSGNRTTVVPPSFEAAFRAHYPRLVAIAAASTGSIDAGHDAAQETMARAFQRWPEVADYEHLGAWLRRVLANLLIDRHRAQRCAAAAPIPPDGATAVAELSRWHELVAGLPQQQRLIVTLFYGDDQSVDDIAAQLGISTGTVKSSLSKARDNLRRTWKPEDLQ